MPRYTRTRRVVVAALLLAAAVPSLAAPPTDEQITIAIEQFQRASSELAGSSPDGQISPKQRKELADKAMAQIDLAQISTEQLESLQAADLMGLSSRRPEFLARLKELSQSPDASGAAAASMRLHFLRGLPRQEQLEMLRAALTHPGLADAYRAGRAEETLIAMRGIPKSVLDDLRDVVLGLGPVFTGETAPEIVARTRALLDAALALSPEDAAAREPLRSSLSAAIAAAQPRVPAEDKSLANSLDNLRTYVDGAYAKGELIGHPAPDLDITWCSSDPPITSLSQFKGSVLVLEFWANADRHSIESFADIRSLLDHYQGSPVVVLGVTGVQGFFATGETDADGKAVRIDTSGNPSREFELMPSFMKARGVTWPVVAASQGVFNSDYGVSAVPHLVIIDPKGIVRHRAVHPNSKITPLAEKTAMIDTLLIEAGLPAPPPPASPPSESQPAAGPDQPSP
ncbi:MAG: TlpA family protein disulfide reductase [Phycisphaeraceae bacterium]|nr:TlpA family protein disulfide reductase [Phycisphaeraceae bacterium]